MFYNTPSATLYEAGPLASIADTRTRLDAIHSGGLLISPEKPRSGSSWPSTVDLAKDNWAFEAQWSARRDDLSSCTDRLLACLNGVASLDPRLAHWFYDSEPVAIDAASIRDRLDRGWDREHPGGETGTSVSLWNGVKDDLALATISIGCGSTASYVRNDIEFEPPRPAAMPGLYRLEAMPGLFEMMISVWQPQWCLVRPWSLREATGREFVDVLASWIVYLDRSLHTRKGALPSEVRVIEGPGDGDVFVLAPTPDEPRLATIDRVREALAFRDDWSLLR